MQILELFKIFKLNYIFYLGKYGYIDPDGNLREASYGAEAGRGFEPQIEGLELPPPVTAPEETFNEIPEQVPQKQFQNFQPTENTNNANKFKIVNGRRALVKKVSIYIKLIIGKQIIAF